MTKEEFVARWCREHNLGTEFFERNFRAIKWPDDDPKYKPNPDFGHDGWLVSPQTLNSKLRLPVAVLKKITAEIASTPQAQQWDYTSSGGNFLVARRGQSEDKWGKYDWVDFSWNEGD